MDTTRLESFIFEKMSATRLPGLSIALVKEGKTAYARGFGLADIAGAKPVTPSTLFGAASITKSFIGIAILQLAEKGLLKLSDPVERHVQCPLAAKTAEPIRIEHLLTHTSGMPALAYIEAVLRHAHNIGGCNLSIGNAADVVTFTRGSEDWVESAPGERWFYLNEGYVILGQIIQRVTGQCYDEYLREHIFSPLGMSHSCFAEADVCRHGDVALPYVLPRDGSPPRAGRYLYNVITADGSIITSATDLSKYLFMFLHNGRGVMSPESFEAMIKPRIATTTPGLHYGYGVNITPDFFGQPLIAHSGSLVVSTSYFGFLPESNIGVALLCNGNGYGIIQLGKVALAMMIGKAPEDLPFVRMENLLKDLTGFYETYRGTLRAKITREGDFLRIEYLCGDQPPGVTICVPDSLDADAPRFYTTSEGARYPVEFRRRDNDIELIFERYKFKRTGPLI